MSPARALLYGTLSVAALDILDAIAFWGLRGVAPIRVFQGIAAGLLGRESFGGGVATGILGACLHLLISFSVVSVYNLASARLGFLTRRPWIYGPAYGVLVYLFMYRVVLPLSAAPSPKYSVAHVANGLFAHLFLVGLPSALAARAARTARRGRAGDRMEAGRS